MLLKQSSEDIPKMMALEEKLKQKVACWERNLIAARAELSDCQTRLARKRAFADATIAQIHRQDRAKVQEEKTKKLTAEHDQDRPKPSQSRRLA